MKKKFENKFKLYQKLILIIKKTNKPFIISGGNTIKDIFGYLNQKLNNTILLSDERLVNKKSRIRNSFFFQKLIKKKYINKNHFIFYKSSIVNHKEIKKINNKIKKIKFKLAILSLGSNGHIASIFYVKKEMADYYYENNSPKFPRSRVTVSLNKLKKCNKIIIVASKKNKINEINNFSKNKILKFLGLQKISLFTY